MFAIVVDLSLIIFDSEIKRQEKKRKIELTMALASIILIIRNCFRVFKIKRASIQVIILHINYICNTNIGSAYAHGFFVPKKSTPIFLNSYENSSSKCIANECKLSHVLVQKSTAIHPSTDLKPATLLYATNVRILFACLSSETMNMLKVINTNRRARACAIASKRAWIQLNMVAENYGK